MGELSLTESFSKELIKESQDPVLDIAEIGLDSIFDSKLIDEVPVLKSIAAVCKIGLNIRDRYFANKILSFINEFKKNKLDEKKYNEFKTKMENQDYKSKVTETIIVRLDALDDINKTIIIAKLVSAFINKKISWEEFLEFSNVGNYLVKEDYETLKLFNKDSANLINFDTHERKDLKGSAYKLVQYSLVTYEISTMLFFGSSPASVTHKITEKGIKFWDSLNA
ncbi:hypothetical protein [Clostridium magnum]|uniref:hypothetical protein n=1 Tax=Clostridium magnum TaxID=33954 RepID=UPI000913640F|nr:hypothetical protein [Clostridium magnum]SHJ12957.1 hypothetical protein SAMN02745944_05403 [Clostridium magnum DSM 2767]